jgi:hypothetical protein
MPYKEKAADHSAALVDQPDPGVGPEREGDYPLKKNG